MEGGSIIKNELVESLLYDSSRRSLDHLLTTSFKEHASFTLLPPTYMANFFMGMALMLMTDEIKAKYGIRRVFFINSVPKNMVRMAILMDKSSPYDTTGKKSMKVRTFDMRRNGVGYDTLLTAQEYQIMKKLLLDEKPDVMHGKADIHKGRLNLDDYPLEQASYGVKQEKIYKADSLNVRSRLNLRFKEYFSNSKLRKQLLERSKIPGASQLLLDSGAIFNSRTFGTIDLISDRVLIKHSYVIRRNMNLNTVLDLYKNYHASSDGRTGLKKFEEMITNQGGIAETFGRVYFDMHPSAECGFVHGLLYFLSYSYPSFIEVRQLKNPHNRAPGELDLFLVHKPKFTGSESSVHQIPIVCTFPRDSYISAKKYVPQSMSVNGEVGAVGISLGGNEVSSKLDNIQNRVDFGDTLFNLVGEHYENQDVLADKIQKEFLEKVRPSFREYEPLERNYLSRYLASWIALTEKTGVTNYALLNRAGDADGTGILIESNEEQISKQIENARPEPLKKAPSNILLVIHEEPRSETHFLKRVILEESYTRFQRLQDEDTLVINIKQDYVHSTSDSLVTETENEADHIEFTTTFSFAKSEDVKLAHEASIIPRLPQKTLDSLLDGKTSQGMKQLEKLLQFGQKFAGNKFDYEAFLDGIFLNNKCLKYKPKGKGVSYIRSSASKSGLTKIDFDELLSAITNDKDAQIPKPADEETRLNPEENQVQIIRDAETSELNVRFFNRPSEQTNVEESDLPVRNFETMPIEQQVTTPRSYKSLEKISKIAHYMMLGFMVRDAFSDAVNEHYWALAKDIGFILLTTTSPVLSPMASLAGESLIRSGSKFAGYTMKGLGFGLKRAISLYVFYDLVENAVKYAQNTNDTDAKLSMEIDAAFVAIDVLTIAAEAMGVGAVFGPIGEVAGALLILGLNVYQTVKTVQQIDSIVPLDTGEMIDESIRAFLHLNIDEYIRELMDEKLANTKLLQDAINYLEGQSKIGSYFTASAEFNNNASVIHGDTIIDMRTSSIQRISRASPGITDTENLRDTHMACFLHEEQIEIEHEPTFWEKVTGFFAKIRRAFRSLDQMLHNNYHSDSEDCDECIKKNTPTCHNAFGVSIDDDKPALFKLGNKSDLVWGYTDKQNIFHVKGGVKNITGGALDDIFVVGPGLVVGVLDGLNGTDILDLFSFSPDELSVSGNILNCKIGSSNSSLKFQNIETIILPATNLIRSFVNISKDQVMRRIVSDGDMHVNINDDISMDDNEMIIEFSGNLSVINKAHTGFVTYLIKIDQRDTSKNASLYIQDDNLSNHDISLMENLYDIHTMLHQDGRLLFQTISGRAISLFMPGLSMNNTQVMFQDGTTLLPGGNTTVHASLSTELRAREIEKIYAGVVERLGILMTAYSRTDRESITISHGSIRSSNSTITNQVLQNSDDHSTHIVLNGGQYLILIVPNRMRQVEETTIRSSNAENLTKVDIDLSAVLEVFSMDKDLLVGVQGCLIDDDLEIHVKLLHLSNNLTSLLGKIILEDISSDDFFKKITIRNYGEITINLMGKIQNCSNQDNGNLYNIPGSSVLTPSPMQFPNSSDVILLTPYNVEPFNRVTVDINAGKLDPYSINATTLVLTNFLRNRNSKTENVFTVFLEGFYSFKKMSTLELIIGGERINLKEYEKTIAPDFSNFWADAKMREKRAKTSDIVY